MYTPLSEITAEAMALTKNATTTDRLMFRQWAFRGLRELGPAKEAVKNCEIPVKTLTIKKPSDMQSAIDLALYDAHGNEVNYKYAGRGKSVSDKNNTIAQNYIQVSEDAYFYFLSSDGEDIKTAKLRYFALPQHAETGELMIPDDFALALVFFIRYMYSLRMNENQSEISQNRDIWSREKRRAQSRNKMPSMMEGEQIMKSWMSMISTFNHDTF